MTKVDVVVVGAGVAGAAAAQSLAKAGREVVLLERFELGHARGSSHGTSRIFRFAYDDPRYVRLAMTALPMWRELEDEVGEPLVVTTGGLDHGDIEGHLRALRECGANLEMLDATSAGERWPALAFPPGARLLFQPDAGYTRADRAVRAFVASAVAHGAGFRENCRVVALDLDGDRALVETEEETLSATVAVVTAGAWAKDLVAGIGLELPVTPTRQTVAYFRMDPDIAFPTLVDWSGPTFYALPAPGEGLKAGEHDPGPVIDPDEPGEVDQGAVERISARVAERYPKADPQPARAETCIYTNTADESFIFERRGPFVVGSVCSGHGFKFGPTTGRRLAKMATGG